MQLTQSKTQYIIFVCLFTVFNLASANVHIGPPSSKITIIHIGDLHGQLESRINSGSQNREAKTVGGLARVMSQVKKIRRKADNKAQTHFTLLLGDTTQGGVEVAFTQGNAIIGIVNQMNIDLFALGNWDFVYGTCRTHELWNFNSDALAALNAKPQIDCSVLPGGIRANFKTIAANAYVDNNRNSANCPAVADRIALFDSYQILTDPRSNLKIAVIAFTTERGPRVIGHPVVEGICFTKGDQEIVELVTLMNLKRAAGEVDAVIMISELNIANNRRVIDLVDAAVGPGGIDIVLSTDMHEVTPSPIYTKNGTPLVAQGHDGQNIGEIELDFKNRILQKIKYKQHLISLSLKPDPEIAALVAIQTRPFIDGTAATPHFVHGRLPPRAINDLTKSYNVNQTLAIAGVDVNRHNFSHQVRAALFEGTGHSMMTDGMRESAVTILATKLQAGDLDQGSETQDLCQTHDINGKCTAHFPVISVIRGFRYGASIMKGRPITLNTLYEYSPIGAFASLGVVTGTQIRGKGVPNNAHPNAGGMEHSAFSSLTSNVRQWGGGWVFNWSGLKYDLDPYAEKDNYTANIKIGTQATGYQALDDTKNYIIVGFGFDKTLFGIESPVPELQFINKPFKTRFVTPNIYRIVYQTDSKSTLDPSNPLDLAKSDFRDNAGAAKSMTVVDLVARYLLEDFTTVNKNFTVVAPMSRVTILCPLPNMKRVKNTGKGIIIDPTYPIIDIGFPFLQSLFGGNKNLLQYLEDSQQAQCRANGVIF